MACKSRVKVKVEHSEKVRDDSDNSDSEAISSGTDDDIETLDDVLFNSEQEPLMSDKKNKDLNGPSHKEITNLLKLPDKKFVTKVFSFVNPHFIDVSNEITSSQPYLILADNLLLEIFCQKNVNKFWGGQTLVVVYFFEKFLQSLLTLNGPFKLVWFRDLADLYVKDPSLSLMYHVTKMHIESTPDVFDCLYFDNPMDPSWKKYLNTVHPPFVMVSSETSFDSVFDSFSLCFCHVAYTVLEANVSTVSFSGLQRLLTSMNGFHAQLPPRCLFDKTVAEKFASIWSRSVAKFGHPTSATASKRHQKIYTCCESFWCDAINDVKKMLKKDNIDDVQKACQLFILTVIVQKVMPLSVRTCKPGKKKGAPSSLRWVEETFVNAIIKSASKLLVNSNIQFTTVDLYDGKLYSAIYANCFRFVSKDDYSRLMTLDSKCYANYADMCKNCHIPVVVKDFTSTGPWSSKKNAATKQQHVDNLSMIINNNELVKQYFQSPLNLLDCDKWFVEIVPFFSNKFFETYHWHSGKLLREDVGNKKPQYKQNSSVMNWFAFYGKSLESKTKPTLLNDLKSEHENDRKSIAKAICQLQKENRRTKDPNFQLKLNELLKNYDVPIESHIVKRLVEFIKIENEKLAQVVQSCSSIDTKQQMAITFLSLLRTVKNYNKFLTQRQREFVEDQENLLCSTVEIDLFSYQLQYCGHLLDVQTNPRKDERVNFLPDSWQVDLLDIVDNNHSALIVAPTSAGKTFISYYCIEKVLSKNDGGILVFVSPTKALVNQVAATVYHCFQSQKCANNDQSVFGIFTRDYRIDVLNCRVLVTVPQCLEILLLSPCHQQWTKKIKYVIFDEIHCIGGGVGDKEGSEVWEHILLMIECPFLALSATVGNPKVLLKWLNASLSLKNELSTSNPDVKPEVKLISTVERISELEYFMYNFTKKNIETLHPLSAVSLNDGGDFYLPDDMQLTAKQTYALYKAMGEVDAKVRSPVKFFSKKEWQTLNRKDLRKYDKKLKETFEKWVNEDANKASAVVSNINKETGPLLQRTYSSFNKFQLVDHVLSLVLHMKEQHMLPCLAFSDNRNLCFTLAKPICDYFEKQERESGRRAAEDSKWQTYQKQHHYEFPHTEFSLRSARKHMGLFYKVIKRLRRRDRSDLTEIFIKLLYRGIGVHHSGLTLPQRQSVEILFRAGYLEVVFSTSTLALGINMPCRSVVFCWDTIYLTLLNYRQMSGRAGRRGFDEKGNVIFFGIPPAKIMKLLNSNLPDLKGNLPFGVSFVLRLLILTAESNNTEENLQHLIRKCLICLKSPLIVETLQSAPMLQNQLDCYFAFCIQLLHQLNVINDDGQPIGLAGMISHLHYHEPGNLIFAYFLQKGLFHELCQRYSEQELMEKIVVVLAHIFTNSILPNDWSNGRQLSQSTVILKPLPKPFHDAMITFNNNVKLHFLNYIRVSTVDQEKKRNEVRLPLSRFSVGSKYDGEIEKIVDVLRYQVSTIQNPIAAIAGFRDKDTNILDGQLVSALDETLHFDPQFLPTKPYPFVNHRGKRMNLNAYALDFYEHENWHALRYDNQLFEGDIYHLLKDFMLTITAISTALDFLAPPQDPVRIAFQKLSESYKRKYTSAFGYQ